MSVGVFSEHSVSVLYITSHVPAR